MRMLREELFHPLMSHFPLVLLGLCPAAFLYLLFNKEPEGLKTTLFMYRSFLYLGLATFVISMFLGDMALEAISSSFCEVQKAYRHEDDAYYALYIYCALLVLDYIYQHKTKTIVLRLMILVSLFGSVFIFKTGHSGAQLVYEYGAAVKGAKSTTCQ